ncbi:HNH endonuclease [Thalassovita mediterranea]|nr:HNH endonuclease [Thalassovita mediterranea]
MSVWWVNHKSKYKFERNGGYLWSPKRKTNGSANRFYSNMTLARPGDFVISFASTEIKDIGVVRSEATTAAKPAEYDDDGNDWNNIGWMLPVRWHSLGAPVRPQNIIAELAPELPEKYSPIRAVNGHGNQAAYLASVSEGLLSVILKHCSTQDVTALQKLQQQTYPSDPIDTTEDVIENAITDDDDLSTLEKESLVKARRGQGQFKQNVIETEGRCRLSGVEDVRYLIGSHILPWRACRTASERLDGNNGLLLCPNADRLFDRGLISFEDDGTVLVKAEVSDEILDQLGFPGLRSRNVGSFSEGQKKYLAFHRELYEF